MRCDHSARVDIGAPPCKGWTALGFPWHGCDLDPGHGSGKHLVEHECRCGHKWKTRPDR